MVRKRRKSTTKQGEPHATAETPAKKLGRILKPPSLPVILDAAEEETGTSINCGFSINEIEQLKRVIPKHTDFSLPSVRPACLFLEGRAK